MPNEAAGERRLLARSRQHLALRYLVLLGGTLALVTGVAIGLVSRFARQSLEARLAQRAELVLASPAEAEEASRREQLTTYVIRAGRVRRMGPALDGLPDWAAVRRAQSGRRDFRLLRQGLAVLTLPVRAGEVVEVAADSGPYQDAVHDALLALTVVGLAAVLASWPAAFWMAGRALEPLVNALVLERAFVANASHELSTPLTILRTQAELALRAEDPAAWRAALADSLVDVAHMTRIVRDLLDLTRYEARHLSFGWVDAGSVVEEVGRLLSPLAQERGVALDVAAAPGAWARADEHALRQLVIILVDNALKFTDPGGRVSVSAHVQSRRLVLRVADTGAGIPEEEIPHIFDRFYRGREGRRRAQGGAGLGLSLARAIVLAHGGRIQVSSRPGEGTVFTVEMPLG